MIFVQAGILFSLFATYLRVLAKTFPCHPLLKAVHLIIVCLLFTSVALQLFGKKKEVSAPIVPFIGIGVYAVAPIIHSAIVSESQISIASVAWLFLPHLLVINKKIILFPYYSSSMRIAKGWPGSAGLCPSFTREPSSCWYCGNNIFHIRTPCGYVRYSGKQDGINRYCRPLGVISPDLACSYFLR